MTEERMVRQSIDERQSLWSALWPHRDGRKVQIPFLMPERRCGRLCPPPRNSLV